MGVMQSILLNGLKIMLSVQSVNALVTVNIMIERRSELKELILISHKFSSTSFLNTNIYIYI
jgi:hypothetical protein